MSIWKRFILLFLGMALFFLALPFVLFEELATKANSTQIILYLVVGFLLAGRNFLKIYQKANTITIVMTESINPYEKEKVGEKHV